MNIELADGFKAKYFIASGGLAFDGRGWWWERLMQQVKLMEPMHGSVVVILKTLTMLPKKGNLNMRWPMGCVRRLSYEGDDVTFAPWTWKPNDGFLNAVGLTNPGLDAWIRDTAPIVARTFVKVAASIKPDTPEECALMIERLCGLKLTNMYAIEINASCPNIGHDDEKNVENVIAIVRMALEQSTLPVILKLGYENDIPSILSAFKGTRLIVDVINTVRYRTIYPEKHSPLLYLGGGGVSGPRIESFRDMALEKVRGTGLNFPIILGGGIHDEAGLKRACALTPDAIAIGTALLKDPNFLVHYV